jgi:hypothetical protein
MQNRETLGGINRSLQQSTFITEPYFYIHDNTKLRLLELNLETAKHCYKDQDFSLNIMDDGLIGKVLKVKGKMLSETAYGMYLSDGKDDAELFQYIRQYAHAALQNDTSKFKDIFEIMKSKSIAAVGRKMEEAEDERVAEKELDAQRANEAQMSATEAQIKWDQMKFQQMTEIELRKLENEIILKGMDLDAIKYKTDVTGDVERSRIEADINASKDKLKIQLETLKQKNEEFNRKLIQDREQFNQQIAQKKKQKVA